jgi:NTE family protein
MSEGSPTPIVLSPRSQQALLSLPAFRGLGEAERRKIAGLVSEIAVAKGETVYRAGEDADALYLVASGAVDVVHGTRVITRYGPGEVFGESALVLGERRLVTTRVALDATLIVLRRERLAQLLEVHPSLHERLSIGLARRAKDAVRLALAAPTGPSEIVVLEGWTSGVERRAFVEGLADALERELERPVAIVTVEEISTRVRDIPGMIRILPTLLYLGADFNVTRPGLFAGEHFQRVLEGLGPIKGRSFADLQIPFRAIATDIGTGARVELADGELSDAMRASFSAPWIFSPFRIGEHVLIDGGMSDPVPAETVRSMGADLVIGVNVVPPVYPQAQNPLEAALRALGRVRLLTPDDAAGLPNSFDVIVRTLQVMQHELGNVRAGEADVLINPDLREYWVLEFWGAREMIEQGRRAAEAELPEIRKKVEALRGRAI